MELSIERESGTGRAFILLYDGAPYDRFVSLVFEAISAVTRTLLVRSPRINTGNWNALSGELIELLEYKKIRQASFIGFGAAGSLVQNVALRQIRLVRTCALVDAATRAHPSKMTRLIDRVERALPLGLPLRSYSRDFDAKPFLQRIRCPVLIITSAHASAHERAEADVLVAALPVAWKVELPAANEVEELAKLVLAFQDVPARRPQKNVAARSVG